MPRLHLIRRAVLVSAVLTAVIAAPASAGTSVTTPSAPTPKLAYTAKILITTNVFKQPGKGIETSLPTHAQWGGGPHVLLVLDSREFKGKTWLRVALPDRPNGSSGWIREDFVRLSTTPWRVTINRAAHVVTVYRDGPQGSAASSP